MTVRGLHSTIQHLCAMYSQSCTESLPTHISLYYTHYERAVSCALILMDGHTHIKWIWWVRMKECSVLNDNTHLTLYNQDLYATKRYWLILTHCNSWIATWQIWQPNQVEYATRSPNTRSSPPHPHTTLPWPYAIQLLTK